jgi:alkylhydroperoxidase family enzyme
MAHLRGSADEIRARVPAVLGAYERTRDTVLRSGVADQRLKERCFAYLATGVDAPEVRGLDERERAALEWAAAIVWDSDRADDALWSRLHALFSEPELVDLGCAIGFELGYQHWRRTIGLPARESS